MKHFTNRQLEVMVANGGTAGRRAEIELKNRELIEKFAPKDNSTKDSEEKVLEHIEKTIDKVEEPVVESSPEPEEKPKPKRRGRRKKVVEEAPKEDTEE